jgi:hypothetical protein
MVVSEAVDTCAWSTRKVPVGVARSTWTVSVNVALASAASVATVQVTVPVPPTAGVEHVKVGPLSCATETNVVPRARRRSA